MPRTITSVAYGADPLQKADLYLPDRPKPTVVVLIHGGFWYAEYAADLMVPLAEDLASRGYAAWNIEYRRIGNDGGAFPGTLDDVHASVEKLGEVAHRHGLDLSHLTSVGHSAGGHLALWLAGRHHVAAGQPGHGGKVRVTAAVGQAPVADLARAFEMNLGSGAVGKFLGGSPADVPDRYKSASPISLLPLGVPQLIVHGDADRNVPIEISQRYVDAAKRANEEIDFVTLPGAGHFVHIDPKEEAWLSVVRWLDRKPKRA